MKKIDSTLLRSKDILHSSLAFLLLACALHLIFVSSPLRLMFPAVVFIFIILKVCLYSGAFGCMAELASDEIVKITHKNFTRNLESFALFYLALTVIQFLCEGGLKHILANSFGLAFTFEIFFFDTLILFIMAKHVMTTKYIKPFKLPKRQLILKSSHIITLVILFLIDGAIRNLNVFLSYSDTSLFANLPTLAHFYVQFLTFLYIIHTILEIYPEITEQLNKNKDFYLINPLSRGVLTGMASSLQSDYPPVFVVLKAFTPKGYKTKEFNRVHWKDRFYQSGKLVAITCYTSNSPEAYKIAKEFKKRGSKVIMGGPHVTYIPDEALEFCDSVVIGEAESVWKDVVKDFENNTLKKKYFGVALDDFHSVVHQELLNSPPEVVKDFLETTRGCKFRCSFCTIPSLSGGKARKKPVSEIVELIEKIKYKYSQFVFLDNNIYSDPAYAKELFTALKPLKVKWGTQCTIDIAKNKETLTLAKESGCSWFLFGYEIFGGSLEKQQGGKFALANQYRKFTSIIKKCGIGINGHFIFGFDSDNIKNALTMWKFCFLIRPYFTIISMLTPLPGSQVFHEMISENRINNFNWRGYNCQNLVFEHKLLNNSFLQTIFSVMRYTYFLTTSKFGIRVLLIITISTAFLALQYM